MSLKDSGMEGQREDLLELDGQREGVEEDVDLEDTQEEEAEMFEHLGEEIPEEADVGGQVRHRETGGRGETSGNHDYSRT